MAKRGQPTPAQLAQWWSYFEATGAFHPERVAWQASMTAGGADIPAGLLQSGTTGVPMLGAALAGGDAPLAAGAATAAGYGGAGPSLSAGGTGNSLVAATSTGSSAAATGAGAAAFPFGLVIAAGFMLYGILGRSNAKDQRTEGYGFRFRDNPADPNDPIALWYGYPVVTPPVLFSYLSSENLNSRAPAKGQKFVTCLSLGGGPIDGRDLQLWMNGRRLMSKVKETDPASSRTLTPIPDSSSKVWAFPVGNVKPSTVTIYQNGTAIAAGGDSAGTITASAETQVTTMMAKAREFTSDDHADIAEDATRYGCYLPVSGDGIRDITMEVFADSKDASISTTQVEIRRWRVFGSGRITVIKRNRTAVFTEGSASWSSPVRVARDDDGKQYLWVNATKGGDLIGRYKLTYKIKPQVHIENRSGTWVAVFNDAQTPTLTWSGETSELGDSLKFHFRNGAQQQDPLPVDGIRTATALGDELTQGTTRNYTTPDDVDDVELVIESGPQGFYDHAIAGSNACDFRATARRIQVKVREDGASDNAATKNDPATGWVTLGHPEEDLGVESGEITLRSSSGGETGTARWFLSIADLLAAKQGRNADFTTGHNLPKRVAYEVQVVALDKENAPWGESEELDRIRSELFLAAAQDIRRVKMSLPYHATLTIEIDDLEDLPAEPVFRVQCAGRQVWVPSAGATYSSDTERLEPGSMEWSRNPVWIASDLITNPVFGGGEWYGWSNIDATKALAAATFCDDTSLDGDAFAQLDIAYTRRSAMWDHVSQACAGARILPAMSGGTWRFEIDQDGSTVMDITEDDIAYQSGSLQLPGVEEIPTDLEVAFTDEEQDFELDTELRSREGEPAQRVVRRIDLTGVRRRSQVIRAGDLALRQFDLNRRAIRVAGSTFRLLLLEAGDLVTLTNTVTGDATATYRVMGVGWGPNFLPAVELAEHDPAAYVAAWNPFRIVTSNRPPAAPPSGAATTTKAIVASTPYIVRNTSMEAVLARLTATRIAEAS